MDIEKIKIEGFIKGAADFDLKNTLQAIDKLRYLFPVVGAGIGAYMANPGMRGEGMMYGLAQGTLAPLAVSAGRRLGSSVGALSKNPYIDYGDSMSPEEMYGTIGGGIPAGMLTVAGIDRLFGGDDFRNRVFGKKDIKKHIGSGVI